MLAAALSGPVTFVVTAAAFYLSPNRNALFDGTVDHGWGVVSMSHAAVIR